MASTPTTQRRIRRAVAIVVVCTAWSAAAEPTMLQANPAGSLSIDTAAPAPITADNSPAEDAGPPLLVAEALEIEPAAAAQDETQPDASTKPLGAKADLPIAPAETSESTTTTAGGWAVRTALALAAVIGLILLCKMAFLKLARQGGGTLSAQLGAGGRAPSGLLSVLARYPVAKGSTLVLLRLDRRVLLLSQTGQGFTTLAEIDDPEEVAALIMRAEDEEGASLTRRFRTMLSQAESDPGLVGEREYEIDPVVPMTPRTATARFHEIAMQQSPASVTDDEHADAVGSLRDRLRSMREVSA